MSRPSVAAAGADRHDRIRERLARVLPLVMGMMRITEITRDDAPLLRVEGAITRQGIGELLAICVEWPGGIEHLQLDLAGVRFVDPAGIDGLRSLQRDGTRLIGCSGFLDELLRRAGLAENGRDPGGAPPDQGESELLAGLWRGDHAAYERLVREQSPRLLATARRFLRTEEDAQDAVQEAFLAGFKAIEHFSGQSKLSTWLHRIVVNVALMKLRSRKRRPEDAIEDMLPHFDETGHWAEDTSAQLPGEQLERRETRQLVRRCIDQLPASYREVLLLRDIEDLDTDEVAELLRITPNATKIRLHRARQALRTLLVRALDATQDAGDQRRAMAR